MTNKFIPKNFLNAQEEKLLDLTRSKIKNAKSKDELEYLELLLDVLMMRALDRYRKNTSDKEIVTN